MNYHTHHIIPRHRGGTDDKDNLVRITTTQHAMWHFAEWQLNGYWQDRIAWKGLSGMIGREEIISEARRQGAIKGGKAGGRKGFVMTDEQKSKLSKIRKERYGKTDEEKAALKKAHRETPAYKARKNELARANYKLTKDKQNKRRREIYKMKK